MEEVIVNGVKVGEIDDAGDLAPKPGESRDITLPSGKVATIRKGKGRDLIRVQRAQKGMKSDADSEDLFAFALVAELTKIDNHRITAEHLLEMPLEDVLKLQAEVLGDNFLSLTPATSQS